VAAVGVKGFRAKSDGKLAGLLQQQVDLHLQSLSILVIDQ